MWLTEARQSLRSLFARRNRRAVAAAVAVLALGLSFIGSVLGLVEPFTVGSLPYPDSRHLVYVQVSSDGIPAGARLPALDEWSADPIVAAIAPIGRARGSRVQSPAGADVLVLQEVSREFLDVMGVPVPSEAWLPAGETGATPLLLTETGRQALGRDLARPGTTLAHERGTFRIAGALPASFVFPDPRVAQDVDGLLPYQPPRTILPADAVGGEGRVFGGFSVAYLVRIAEGAPVSVLAERLAASVPRDHVKLVVEPLSVRMTAHVSRFAWGAAGLGALIFLICAGNLTNISLAHAAFRLPEFMTRRALGASQPQLLRLLVVERLLIVIAAVTVAIWVTWLTVRFVAPVMPDQLLTFGAPRLSARVVIILAAGGLSVGLLSLAPAAWLLWRRSSHARVVSGSVRVRGMAPRSLLVAGQCALVMVMSVGAGLLLRSHQRLTNQDTGFDRNAAAVSVSYPLSPRGTVDLMPIVNETAANLRLLPGVRHVGLSRGAVVNDGISRGQLMVSGRPVVSAFQSVSPEFFQAAGMAVVKGRSLLESDLGRAAVVNESFVRGFLASSDSPLGQLLARDSRSLEVVGVVRDAFDRQLDVAPTPTVYLVLDRVRSGAVTFVISPGNAVIGQDEAVRRFVTAGHQAAALQPIETIGDRFSASIRDRTFATQVLTVFSAGGVLVCLAGVAGIVAFIIGRRTHEIAVRMSLGAGPKEIRRLVLGEPLASAIAGLAAGLLAGQWLSRYLEHLLYGIAPADWRTATAVAALIVTAVTAVGFLAARDAVRTSPADGLRES